MLKISISIFLCLTFTTFSYGQSSNQAYRILDDNPIANMGYLGIGVGYNSKSASNTFFDYQGHFLKGRISLIAEYGFEGLLNGMINEKTIENYNYAVSLSNSYNSKEKLLHPKSKIKLGSDYEIGLGYNFFRTKKLKKRNVYVAQDRTYKYYVKREMTEIIFTGSRFGFGSYRGTLFGSRTDIFQNSFTSPELMKSTKWDSVLNIYTNFYSSYIFIGAQKTIIRNVKVSDVMQKRRAVNATFYFDVLMLLKNKIDNVRYDNENKEYIIAENDKKILNTFGARVGVQFRATRYAFLFYGLEGGFMPGYNITSPNSEFKSFVDDNRLQTSLYLKFRLGLSLTSPRLKIHLNEKKK